MAFGKKKKKSTNFNIFYKISDKFLPITIQFYHIFGITVLDSTQ